jgi:hypothetical protein
MFISRINIGFLFSKFEVQRYGFFIKSQDGFGKKKGLEIGVYGLGVRDYA